MRGGLRPPSPHGGGRLRRPPPSGDALCGHLHDIFLNDLYEMDKADGTVDQNIQPGKLSEYIKKELESE